MKNEDLLLYLPAAMKSVDPTGGQVIAARGFVEYLSRNGIGYVLLDHANSARKGRFLASADVLVNALQLLVHSLFRRYKSFLCFYSSFFGLFIRFLPALLLQSKGCNAAIFFRNSQIYRYSGIKLLLIKFLLSPYSVLLVQGSHLKSYLREIGLCDKKIVVIPNWLSPDFKIKPKNEFNKTSSIKFVFASKIVTNKGIYALLDAFFLNRDTVQFTLDVVGWGPESKACEELIRKNGASNNIFMRGEIPHDKLLLALKNYDVLLLPSFHEGLPNSILEAFSVGLPVIASCAGEISDTVKDGVNGFIIDPNVPSTIYEAMRKYTDNPELIEEHSLRAVETVRERHDWNKNCSRLLTILLGETVPLNYAD